MRPASLTEHLERSTPAVWRVARWLYNRGYRIAMIPPADDEPGSLFAGKDGKTSRIAVHHLSVDFLDWLDWPYEEVSSVQGCAASFWVSRNLKHAARLSTRFAAEIGEKRGDAYYVDPIYARYEDL